jgi:hypothetical protein
LRSGKYQEGKGWLKKDEPFCPLGVACEVKQLRWYEGVTKGYVFGDYVSNDLPVYGWQGLTTDDMLAIVKLSNAAVPFPAIAAWIEANL